MSLGDGFPLRLDIYLSHQEGFASRSQAQAAIRGGLVSVNGAVVRSASLKIQQTDSVVCRRPDNFVSRAGAKLEQALKRYQISAAGKVCLDIGASTGGFTECLLRHGAAFVYALDVGQGQLSKALRQDPRVESREKTNCRYLRRTDFAKDIDLVTMDVSFISSCLIIPAITEVLKIGGEAVILIKPQFEIGPHMSNDGGIVSDPELIRKAVDQVIGCAERQGLNCLGGGRLKVYGKGGNTEFPAYFRYDGKPKGIEIKSE